MSQKIALVTGANRGIGLEVAKELSQKGMKVILTARDEKKGKQALEQLESQGCKDLVFCQLDQADEKSVNTAFEFVKKKFGKLDVLVNNGGVFLDSKQKEKPSALSIPASLLLEAFQINTLGPYRLIQAFLPLMMENDYGRIVNVSSGMGQLSDMNGGYPSYRVSKTSLNALTKIFSQETQGKNILINAVCPGWVRTDMGGSNATRPVEKGAETIVWAATLEDGGPTGSFFRDKERISW